MIVKYVKMYQFNSIVHICLQNIYTNYEQLATESCRSFIAQIYHLKVGNSIFKDFKNVF